MNLVSLTEKIIKSLVNNEDAVSVKEFPTEEENVILIQVIVAEVKAYLLLKSFPY